MLLCIWAAVGVIVSAGQSPRSLVPVPGPPDSGRRLALVIGNDQYADRPLTNAANDAVDISTALRDKDFAVDTALNVTQEGMERAVSAFVQRTQPGDTVLFYYSGHGIQIDGDNRLLGIDFTAPDEVAARHRSLSASEVLERLRGRRTRLRLMVLDACRDNPFEARGLRSLRRGLASMDGAASGTLIAFATAPGETASDNPSGRNGLFTSLLLEAMRTPGREVIEIFHDVQQRVAEVSALKQVPWFSSGLVGRFFFSVGEPAATRRPAAEDAEWTAATASGDAARIEKYLLDYGGAGKFGGQARLQLARLRNAGEPAVRLGSHGAAARPAVAVLGFRNQTGNQATDWMSTALAEGLGTELAVDGIVRTVPGEVVQRMRQELSLPTADAFSGDTLARIRRSIDADFVVSGSVLAVGSERDRRIRLDVRVEDASAGVTVAVFSHTGSETTLFELITSAGGSVREALGLPSPSATQAAGVRATIARNPEALRHYSEGLDHLRRYDALAAYTSLTSATTIEPEYALAHAALADDLMMLGRDSQAVEAARRAVELSNALAPSEQRMVRARAFSAAREWSAAADTYRQLYEEHPDDPELGLRLAEAQYEAGQVDAARATISRLRERPSPWGDDPRLDVLDSEAAAARSKVQEAQSLANDAGRKALAKASWLIVARAKIGEAWAMQRLGRRAEARALNEEAKRLYSAAGDQRGTARALIQLGANLRAEGKIKEAEDSLREALQITRRLGNRRHTARAANNLGNVLFERGALDEAAQLFTEAVTSNRAVLDRAPEATALNNLASVRYEQGLIEEAKRLDEEALRIRRELGDQRGIALSLVNMGEVAADQANLSDARRMYEEAIVINERLEDPAELAYAASGLAAVSLRAGRFSEANAQAQRALSLYRQLGEDESILETTVFLADVALEQLQIADAEKYARSVLAQATRNMPDVQVQAATVLASVLLLKGDLAGAEDMRKRFFSGDLTQSPRPVRVRAALASTRIDLQARNLSEAGTRIRLLLSDVSRLPGYSLEARLLEGEIVLAGSDESGRVRLNNVAIEADKRGMLALARRARRASAP